MKHIIVPIVSLILVAGVVFAWQRSASRENETLTTMVQQQTALLVEIRDKLDAQAADRPQPQPAAAQPDTGTAAQSPASAPRSPFPEAGETITRPIAPAQLAPSSEQRPQDPAPAGQIVAWTDAARYIDQTITIEGKVVDTRRTASVCFLNFDTNWRGKFYVIIFKDALDGWGQPPEQLFLNKTIRATGKVYTHNGRPQIRITKPEQLSIVE